MNRRLTLWLLLSLVPASLRGQELGPIVNAYLAEYWKSRPGSAATAAGIHLYDKELDDLSALAIQQDVQRNKEFLERLQSLQDKSLTLDARVDRQILVDHIQLTLLDLEYTKPAQTRPQSYISLLGDSMMSLIKRQFASTQTRFSTLAERTRQIPRLLKQARTNLVNPPEICTRKALEMIPAAAEFLEKGIPRSAIEQGADKKVLARVQKEAVAAAAALRDFGHWLEKELLPKSKGDAFLGPDLYARRFKYALETEMTPEQVLTSAEADLKTTQAEIIRLAMQVAPGKQLADVFASLSQDAPQGPDLLRAHREAVVQGKMFVEKNRLAPVPQPDRLRIEPAPPFANAGAPGGVFDGAGPFEPELASFYYVSDDGESGSARVAGLRDGVPGRYLQWEAMNRSPEVLRKVFPNPAFVLGWASYAQQVMYEEGFEGQPRDRLAGLLIMARSDLDAIIDIRLHSRQITPAEAVRRLIDQGFLDESSAQKRVERASLYPTQLSGEYVGRLEILRLREDQRKQLGPAFVLGEFHQKLLSLGAPPIHAARELMK